MPRILIIFLFSLVISMSGFSQTNSETISVYLDCRGCDEDFIQTEIKFVNFVRDQDDADVHAFIINQETGSGGVEYIVQFLGQDEITGQDQTLKVISPEFETREERRNRLVSHIKLGLVSYLFEKDIVSQLELNFDNSASISSISTPEYDPWNNWLFEIGGNTNFNGEESQKRVNLNSYVSADRITEDWKFESRYRYNRNKRTVVTSEDSVFASGDTLEVDVTNEYITKSHNFFSLLVKSFGPHWSAGFYTSIRSSTQDNIDFRMAIAPTLEFSLFPYEEFTRRRIIARYGITVASLYYTETTIFNKTEELLLQHEIRIDAEFTQPWGGIEGGIRAEAYHHDFSKNNLRFDAEVSMRVFRGLSVFFSGRYTLINDQLSLPAGDASEEEILLNLRDQATSYSFGGSIGIEITFGSIYNNVINPRF